MSRYLRIIFAFCLLNACVAARLSWAQTVEDRQTPQQELAILRQRLNLARDAWGNWVCAQRHKTPKEAARDNTTAGVKIQLVLPAVDFDRMALEKCFSALTQESYLGIDVDWQALHEAGFSRGSPVTLHEKNISIRRTLDLILNQSTKPVGCVIESWTVRVTTPDRFWIREGTHPLEAKALLALAAPQKDYTSQDLLKWIVQESIAPESWQDHGGQVGMITYGYNSLDVCHDLAVYLLAQDLFQELTEPSSGDAPYCKAAIARLIPEYEKLGAMLPPQPPLPQEMMARVVPLAEFSQEPLSACFDKVGAASGLSVLVRWRVLEKAGINRNDLITLAVSNHNADVVLSNLLDKAGGRKAALGYELENGGITISTQPDLDSAHITLAYGVGDLLTVRNAETVDQAKQALADAIMQRVLPQTWHEQHAMPGLIYWLGDGLVVIQCRRAHRLIADYLASLRRADSHERRTE